MDANMIIANNIQAVLTRQNKRQVDLAAAIGVSRQTMSKIMAGGRTISAMELSRIAEYLHVSMESLVRLPQNSVDTNVAHVFMGRVNTDEAREAIRIADKISDMIVYYDHIIENNEIMEQPWEDDE